MSDIAIRVEGLGKRYSLRHQVRQQGLRHVLQDAVTSLWKPRSPTPEAATAPAAREDFWALRDVSFEVKRGDVVGIIGRNGAGKSTLLKILSRITEPTTGSIEIEGRVASLLEVGTGFHPELTGRENIYLNGAILGMSRAEIRKKFDEIVAFAEVEKFLDTPVKHYSSGMYVRLAFAVAAHLEPEILIVDEVLAVGDAQFQKKCLGKMKDVSEREGRTVLFVSHNASAVQKLCSSALLLCRGMIELMGKTEEVLGKFLFTEIEKSGYLDGNSFENREGTGAMRIISARILNQNGELATKFLMGQNLLLEMRVRNFRRGLAPLMSVRITTEDGVDLVNAVTSDSGFVISDSNEELTVAVKFTDLRFYPGVYTISLWIGKDLQVADYLPNCLQFEIVGNGSLTSRPLHRNGGIYFLTPDWTLLG